MSLFDMQIKKKTVQQKPIKHCKAIYPPIKNRRETLILPRPHTLRSKISDSKLESIGICLFFFPLSFLWGIFLPYDSELSFHYNRNWKRWILSFLNATATKTSQNTCSKLWLRHIDSRIRRYTEGASNRRKASKLKSLSCSSIEERKYPAFSVSIIMKRKLWIIR